MNNIKKSLIPDLKNKKVEDIVQLVQNIYEKRGLSPELELQFIQLRINESPQLLKAAKINPESLYNSVLQAAESGLSLNPHWQEGYFVSYNMKIEGKEVPTITFSPMYRGKKKLLISKGIIKNILTELVYEDEKWDEKIIDGIHQISHFPNSFKRSDPEKIIGGYAIIILNNDQKQYVLKGRDYFEKCLAASKRKMYGKISPAWANYYDQMCKKCLINAADSEIPKIGINAETTKLINDINSNDIDYIDINNDNDDIEIMKNLSQKEFSDLIEQLEKYKISLKSARQKYRGYNFSNEQKDKIKIAGTITDTRLTEIINLIIDENRNIDYFEFYLSPIQMEKLKNSIIKNALENEK